jgi:hypothetical protein
VAQGTFNFASGADPQVRVTVEVGTTEDGPWEPAGYGSNPTIDGNEYWIRFTIDNRDSLGVIFALDISGIDGEVLGTNVCPDQTPIAPETAETCVVGPLPVALGAHSVPFSVTASGNRQPDGQGGYFSPPLEPPDFQDRPISFLVLFETNTSPREALLIEGAASGDSVEVNIPSELEASISLDCATPGEGSEFPVIAYFIIMYDEAGAQTSACEHIPTETLDYTLEGLSDVAVNYTGA